MLHMGMSIAYISSGTLNVLCKVWPPINNVAAIPLDAVANAILPSDRSLARMRLIKNVLPVPPGASKNKMPPSFLSTIEQKQSYLPAGPRLIITVVYAAPHRFAVHLDCNLSLDDTPVQTCRYLQPEVVVGHTLTVACLPWKVPCPANH